MNVDEALRQFSGEERLPRAAIEWSLQHWEQASARYLSKLRAAAARGKPDEADFSALFHIVHLFGEKRDSRAYAPLCDLIASDPEIHEWLGDGVTATLPGLLINLFDGDLEPLQRAIEAVEADEYARGSTLNALSYLVRKGQALGADEMQDYLLALMRTSGPHAESYFWAAWADTASRLGYGAMAPDVARVMSKGWIDRSLTTIEDFHADLAASRSEPGVTGLFEGQDIAPFGSVVETFEQWDGPRDDPWGLDGDDDRGVAFNSPVVNPMRDVGRNDPCPCGSGKKYKKCCLAA